MQPEERLDADSGLTGVGVFGLFGLFGLGLLGDVGNVLTTLSKCHLLQKIFFKVFDSNSNTNLPSLQKVFLWTPKQHVLLWSSCHGLTSLHVSVAQSQAISCKLTTQTAVWPSCSCISSEGSRRTPARSECSVFVGSYTLATCLHKGVCMHTPRSGEDACVGVSLHNVPTRLPPSDFWRIFVDGPPVTYRMKQD